MQFSTEITRAQVYNITRFIISSERLWISDKDMILFNIVTIMNTIA